MTPPSEKPPTSPFAYEYRCIDDSALTGWISRHLAPRIEKGLPAGLSANAITLLGTALVLVAGLAAATLPPASTGLWCGGAAVLIWLYCLLDHVDGCRARARGTSGPLGEFLDHSLDAANIFVVAAVFLAAGRSGEAAPVLDLLLITSCATVTIATWCQQHALREIRLPALGPVEGVLGAVLFLLSLHSPSLRDFWRQSALGPLTSFDLLLIGVSLGMFATSFTIARSSPASRPAILGLTCFGLGGAVLSSFLPALSPAVGLLLGFTTFGLAAKIIAAHLHHRALPAAPWLRLWPTLGIATFTAAFLPDFWPWVWPALALPFAFHAFRGWHTAFRSLPVP